MEPRGIPANSSDRLILTDLCAEWNRLDHLLAEPMAGESEVVGVLESQPGMNRPWARCMRPPN